MKREERDTMQNVTEQKCDFSLTFHYILSLLIDIWNSSYSMLAYSKEEV